MLKLLTISMVISVLFSCAMAPRVKTWRPWTRVIATDPLIPIGSKLAISIEGTTEPLLGKNKLHDNELLLKLELLLKKRGYEIVSDNQDYSILLKYKTERRDRTLSAFYTNSNSNNFNLNYNASGVFSTYGLGAALAQSISAMASASSSSTSTASTTETVRYYTHVISIEIIDGSKIVWNGESTWDSPNVNFLNASNLAIQLLIVNLPKNVDFIPTYKKLQSEKVDNYYALRCNNYWFSAPALPYRIIFDTYSSGFVPSHIENQTALPAYVDLLQTVEEALPIGFGSYSSPLSSMLWGKVMIGEKYRDLKNEKTIKILIKLSGQPRGYIVDKCWVATDEEYAKYEKELKIWQKALYDYYDFYEK